MSSSKEKDSECSCSHKLFMKDISNTQFLKDLSIEYRYEIWDEDKFLCFLEYIDTENRWFFFQKIVEFNTDKNGNDSIYTIEFFEGEKNGK